MKKIKQRLNSRGGFSLVELLLTTIILLLAASIVARGVPAANLVYRETVDKANAQVLLSTAMTVLRDDVGFATALSIENGGKQITYQNPRTGNVTLADKMGSASSEDEAADADSMTMAQVLMISDGMSAKQGYTLEFDTVATEGDGTVTTAVVFTGLRVVKKGYTNPLAEIGTYRIRLINPVGDDSAAVDLLPGVGCTSKAIF